MTDDQYTIQEFYLDVGDNHQLYVQDWGNKNARTPIIFLHGGPGNGTNNRNKAMFNPKVDRVVFFDQRGSGRSLPIGELSNNTTQKLVGDIDKLALKLGLIKFSIVGGSWGSLLALCYAASHPNRVNSLILDGVFLGRQSDIEWLEKGTWRSFFPDKWDAYVATAPKEFANNPSGYHFANIKSKNPEKVKRAVYEYMKMELGLLVLDESYRPPAYDDFDPSAGLIEMHYVAKNWFIAEDHILKNAKKLTMPITIIQGRYDMVCRPANAYRLQKELPHCRLIWAIGGHVKQHEAFNLVALLVGQLNS